MQLGGSILEVRHAPAKMGGPARKDGEEGGEGVHQARRLPAHPKLHMHDVFDLGWESSVASRRCRQVLHQGSSSKIHLVHPARAELDENHESCTE